jgi:hypothetical protein
MKEPLGSSCVHRVNNENFFEREHFLFAYLQKLRFNRRIIFRPTARLFALPVSLPLRLLGSSLKNRLDRSRMAVRRTSAGGRDERCCSCCCSYHRHTCRYHLSAIIKSVKIIMLYMLCGALIMLYAGKFISFYIPMAVITQLDYKKTIIKVMFSFIS